MISTESITSSICINYSTAPSHSFPFDEMQCAKYGKLALKHIEILYKIPHTNLYSERPHDSTANNHPAFMWSCGVLLSAFVNAAKHEHGLLKKAESFADALDEYRVKLDGNKAYGIQPHQTSMDIYYDDNEWLALTLCDLYEISHSKKYLMLAEQTFNFIMTGEDSKLGGGIYWHYKDKHTKNCCSNAPAAAGALRLYQITHKKEYLASGLRLYEWTKKTLQNSGKLYFDNIDISGNIEKFLWSYNTGLMIQAGALLYEITHVKKYLTEAEETAEAGVNYWIDSKEGSIKDEAPFAHLFNNSLIKLSETSGDIKWKQHAERALRFLSLSKKSELGGYGSRWDSLKWSNSDYERLIDQASAAGAFFRASLSTIHKNSK